MTYLLGMSPAEIDRLQRQHETWYGHTVRAWHLAGFGVGQTIVDLGSGPGFSSLGLASLVGPTGRVIAVDASTRATEYLRAASAREGVANLEVVTSDVSDLDVSSWNPDGIFARWLFSFLPDPEAVIARMASCLRPGATVAVMDYWNYLAVRSEPDSPLFRRIFRAIHESFAEADGSLDVAGMLPSAFARSGLRVTDIEPFSQVGEPGSPVWRWISDFLSLYLPMLVENGALAESDIEEFWGWWNEHAERRGTFVFAPPILCVVGVKV